MSSQENTFKYKASIAVLILLLVGLGFYANSMYKDSKKTTEILQAQKLEIANDLKVLATDYDNLLNDNNLKDEELVQAHSRIQKLITDLDKAKVDAEVLSAYKRQVSQLMKEREQLFAKADSLIKQNKALADERDRYQRSNENYKEEVNQLYNQNKELAEQVASARKLAISKLKSNAVIVRKSGRLVNTNRSNRADDVQVCFTLNKNNNALSGTRRLIVQIVNPDNRILGSQTHYTAGDISIIYSHTIDVFYENEALDVCVLAQAQDDLLVSGRYVVNIYDENLMELGTETIKLK